MAEITRTTAPDAGDWFDNLPEAEAAPAAETPEARTARQERALHWMGHSIHQVTTSIRDLGDDLANGLQSHTDRLDHQAVADTVAWVQDQRRALAALEAYAVRELGRMEGTPDTIVLTDGRHAEVMRGKIRKAWDHERWQHDVREAAMADLPEGGAVVVEYTDEDTGEIGTFYLAEAVSGVLAKVQGVPTKGAPSVRALKALGLDPEDYAESAPGPWGMKVSASD